MTLKSFEIIDQTKSFLDFYFMNERINLQSTDLPELLQMYIMLIFVKLEVRCYVFKLLENVIKTK